MDKLGYRARLLKANILMSESSLLALRVIAARYHDPAQFLNRLREMGEFLCEPVSRIQLRSVASARGTEFSRVALLDCLGSTFPRAGLQEEELQLERRLFLQGLQEQSISWNFSQASAVISHDWNITVPV